MNHQIRQIKLLTLFVALLSFLSCKKDENAKSEIAGNTISKEVIEKNKIDFAKIMAQAVTDKAIRNFLKQESLKKFDSDYDVLFPMVKDYKLPNGQTFIDYLNSLVSKNNLNTSLSEIENNLPLLTILIPNTDQFSAETWNIEDEIPAVAVRKEEDIKNNRKLLAYKYDGSILELDYKTQPNIPIIVIKDNEELEIKSNRKIPVATLAHSGIEKYSPVLENNGVSYFFSDENLYKKNTSLLAGESLIKTSYTENRNARTATGCSRVIFWEYYDVLAQQAFDKSIYNPVCPENQATTRDYIYYGIDPTTGVNTGPLKYNYREYITSMRLEDINTKGRFDDFTEGNNLDFDITIYSAGTDPIFPLKKRLTVNKSAFYSGDMTTDLLIYPNDPLEIAIWNFKTQGDTWKFAIFEYDPGSTISETKTLEANLGTNFSIGDEKVGGKFGLTASVRIQHSVTITYTNNSDDLGEAVSYWCDPVITEKFIIPSGTIRLCGLDMGRPLRGDRVAGRSYDISTGIFALTVEPRRKI